MNHSLRERVLTLAGIFQAATLVRRTAKQGASIDRDVETCINSLFRIDSSSVGDIYSSEAHLRAGLQTLITQMGQQGAVRDVELTRYVITLLHLCRKLLKDKAMLQTLRQGIDTAKSQAEYFNPTHENIIAALANLYQQTISTMTPKILVSGEQAVLENPANANLIRTLLLAGIRSAVAWQQCGGNRWQLLFKRSAYVGEATAILNQLPAIDTVI